MSKKVTNSKHTVKNHIKPVGKEDSSRENIDRLKAEIDKLQIENSILNVDCQKLTAIEKKLAESEERYKSLLNSSVNTITIIINRKIVYANPACLKAFGYNLIEELVGRDFSLLLNPVEYDELNKKLARLMEGRSAETAQLKLIRKNGSGILMEFISIPLQYENQPAVMLIGQNITPWKESEKAFRESEQKLTALFNCAPDCILMTDLNYRIRFFNRPVEGYEVNELLEADFLDIISKDYLSEAQKCFETVVKSSDTTVFEFTLKKSASLKWLSCQIALLNYGLNPAGFIITLSDITKQKESAIKLIESERRYVSLFDNIYSGVVILQPDEKARNFVVKDINKAALKIIKKDKSEVKSLPLTGVFHGYTENGIVEELRKVYISGEPKFIPAGLFQTDLFHGWLEHYLYKISGGEVIVVIEDVTEIKRVENNLASSLARYRKLVDTIPYGIDEIDPDGRILFTNTARAKMLGYENSDLTGKTIFDFMVNEEDKVIQRNFLQMLIKDRPAPYHYTNRNRTANGSIIDLQVDWNYLEDKDGNLQGFITVISDITERLKAEKELKAAKEKAEESDRLKSAFLANMSHEVRTPLNGIIGFTSMLNNEKIINEKKKEYTVFIQKAGNQLLNIINNIIDISKIESGQLTIVRKTVVVVPLMNELFDFFQNELKNEGKDQLELLLKTPRELDELHIISDETRLRQVLLNLLTNAVKFTEKGKIEFGYQKLNDTTLQFYVKDTGIGIARENMDLIFERFRQEDESYRREHGGAGLGLAISKGIVEKLGGKIWAESIKNKGSTFYFTVPCVSTISKPLAKPVEKSKYSWPEITILVAEDDPINNALIRATFKNTDARLIYANDGEEALNLFVEQPEIKLVLLDIRLPYIDGYNVARQMKKLRPEIIIIAHSAYAMEKDKQKARNEGFDGYITKPALPEDILEQVDAFIARMRK